MVSQTAVGWVLDVFQDRDTDDIIILNYKKTIKLLASNKDCVNISSTYSQSLARPAKISSSSYQHMTS
jgi:hypothetical protein